MTYNPATHDVHIMAKTLKEVSILVQRRERGRERGGGGGGGRERQSLRAEAGVGCGILSKWLAVDYMTLDGDRVIQ